MIEHAEQSGGRLSSPGLLGEHASACGYGLPSRLFLLFACLVFLSYANTFNADWQLDDLPNILANERIQITALTPEQIWQSMTAKPGSGSFYRPVACFSLGMNWFFGREAVFGYHLVNILIHLATTWVLFLLIGALMRTPRLKNCYPPPQHHFMAVLSAVMWSLNPVQTQAVTYIVQRMTSLATFFAVLALYGYLKARLAPGRRDRYGFFTVALVAYVLGLFSKENVLLLPLAAPLMEMLFFGGEGRSRVFHRLSAGAVVTVSLFSAAALLLRPDSVDYILHFYDSRPFTPLERLLTEQRVLLFYLSLLVFPSPGRLSIEHDFHLSTSLLTPWTTAAAILINAFLILAALKAGRRQPLLALAILFFYLNHIVESTLLPLELVFEHRNYLPSIFLFLPVAQFIHFLLKKFAPKQLLASVVVCLAAVLLSVEGYATHARNKAWQTKQSLWLDALAKAPDSARPKWKLAVLLAWGENPSPAKYRKALELTESALSSRMNRNEAADLLGNMASIFDKLGKKQAAIAYYEKALAIAPRAAGNRYNFAKTLARHGLFASARDQVETLLDQGWEHADYYNLMAFTDLWQNAPARALPGLQKALALGPGRPDILLALGNCLSTLGYHHRAQWFFERAQAASGEKDLVIALNMIQNDLRWGRPVAARHRLRGLLAMAPLLDIRRMLEFSEITYRIVPLDQGRLKDFVAAEWNRLSFP